MKKIILLILLANIFIVRAQEKIVNYNFNDSYGNTVPDLTGNGNDAILEGGAHIAYGRALVGYTDSDFVSVPSNVLNGLTDFTLFINASPQNVHIGVINTFFSASNNSCINCFGIAFRDSDNVTLLSFNGIHYVIHEYPFGGLYLKRHGDTLFYSQSCNCDTSFIVGDSPLDISSLVLGQKQNCYAGCYKHKQALEGGVNHFKVYDYFLYKEADELENQIDQFTIFPNPSSTSFQLNYSLTESSLLTITDAFGRIVKQLMLDASSNNITVSTDDIADGVYLVNLNDGDKRISKKLIVAK